MANLRRNKVLLASKNSEYLKYLQDRAEAERIYQLALANKTMKLRSEGESISLINILSKGDPLVADCKLRLDIADGVAKVCLESMKDIRSDIDSERSLLSWLKAELQSQ